MKASVTFFFASQLSLLNENVCHLLKNRFRFFFNWNVKNKMAGKIKSNSIHPIQVQFFKKWGSGLYFIQKFIIFN